MKLPETACISIKAPNPLPFEPDGFHWCEDVIFDNSTGTIDPDGGFKGSTLLITEGIVQKALVDACGYRPRDIMFFGMGQGGMLALNVAANSGEEFSGVVSIGGSLPQAAPASLDPKCKTPVLVTCGQNSNWVTSESEDKLKRVFQNVQISRYRRSGDTMPRDRDEMMPVMQFFARRLKSTAGVPKGAVEIS